MYSWEFTDYKKAVIDVNKRGIKKFFGLCKTDLQKERKATFLQFSQRRLKNLVNRLPNNDILSRWENFYKKKGVRHSKDNYIRDIADSKSIYKKHLEKHLKRIIFPNISAKFFQTEVRCDTCFFERIIWKNICEYLFVESRTLDIIRNDFRKLLKESIYLATQGGFANNVFEIESGVQGSNAGDAAQFLFLGRAILAGLNCSNVDVRSSKYDAILDQDGKLRKLQIKGLQGNSVSFFSRPRGGLGSNTKHERNIKKRVTKSDCDFLIFVNKANGTCYNIPIVFIDNLTEKKAGSCPLKDLEDFKENWNF